MVSRAGSFLSRGSDANRVWDDAIGRDLESATLAWVRGLLIVLVAGCGRIAFDPLDDSGSMSGDGSTGDGGGTSDGVPDAATACANAVTLQPLTPMLIDTCSTNLDQLDACGPANTREVIFKFTVPTSGGYNFRARDAGTANVSNSTGLLDASCAATTGCVGILSRTFNAGQVLYFVVEASSGTCASIEFENF
jgi:hypothetical protein